MNKPKNLLAEDKAKSDKALNILKLSAQGKYPEKDPKAKKLTIEQRTVLSELLLQQLAMH